MSYKALLFCPNEKTARVVTQILSELEFRVEPCNEPFAAVKKLMAEHFDAIVVDCENDQNATLLFKSAHNSGTNQAALAVAVVEGQSGVAQAFRIGANLVLTKPLNIEQSKGTLRVARGLLRKTEATKAASSPSPMPVPSEASVAVTPKWPPAPQSAAPKPKMTSLPSPPPAQSIPVASASVFDLEEEPAPKPEPTEAALLESMPGLPVTRKPGPDPTAETARSKEYPWQPVSKPMAEPMATALRRAAEAVGKVEADSPAADFLSEDKPPVPSPNVAHTAPHHAYAGAGSGHAGAAVAPAKEAFHSSDQIDASQAPAPLFSSVAGVGADDTEEDSGGRKKLLIAAVVLIAAAGGYMGWTRLHPVTTETSVVQRPPAQIQTPLPSAASPAVKPEPGAASTPLGTSAGNQTAIEGPDITLSTTEPVPLTSNSTKPIATSGKTNPALMSPEPMVVKSEAPKLSPKNPAPEQPATAPDPGTFASASGANDQAISGIFSAASATLPEPPPQAVKVSQGIAQGLLVKAVQPAYPQQARQMRMQGAVELSASINKDGDISGIKVLSGDSMLARAAVAAVKQWKYRPYLLNGQPVEIQTQITVNFKLP